MSPVTERPLYFSCLDWHSSQHSCVMLSNLLRGTSTTTSPYERVILYQFHVLWFILSCWFCSKSIASERLASRCICSWHQARFTTRFASIKRSAFIKKTDSSAVPATCSSEARLSHALTKFGSVGNLSVPRISSSVPSYRSPSVLETLVEEVE